MTGVQTCALPILLTASAFAQAPEKMSYQAVIRDAGNTLVTSQAVGMRLQVLQGSVFGRSEERRVGKECRSRWSPYH